MNPEDLASFNTAVTVAGNNPTAAYHTLKTLEPRNPTDTNLLAWLLFTAPTYQEKVYWANRAKLIAPNDVAVQQALEWFAAQPRFNPGAISQGYTSYLSLPSTQQTLYQGQFLAGANAAGDNYTNSTLSDITTIPGFKRKVKPDAGSSEDLAAKARHKKWVTRVTIAAIICFLAAGTGLFFWITTPNYIEYFTLEEVLTKADKETYAKFRIKLDVDKNFSSSTFDFYGWLLPTAIQSSNKNDLLDKKKQPVGVLLKFDRSNSQVRPSRAEATYYVKVREAYLTSKMVVADVLKVENTLEREKILVQELPQLTFKRVTLTNAYPGLGLSNSQGGRFWLVLDIEIKSPKVNPNLTLHSLWNDIRQNANIVLVNNLRIQDYRAWAWIDDQPKTTTSDKYNIFAGQLVTEVPAEWKEAYFIGAVGNTNFEIPINLSK